MEEHKWQTINLSLRILLRRALAQALASRTLQAAAVNRLHHLLRLLQVL